MDPSLKSLFTVDQVARTVTFPSGVDVSFCNTYSVYYRVFLTDYPSAMSAYSPTAMTLQIVDECGASPTLVKPAQPDPEEYKYTGSSTSLQIMTVPFVPSPASCPISYSCSVQSGPPGHF